MIGVIVLQILFLIFGIIALFGAEYNTTNVIFMIGCFIVHALLQIVEELKKINKFNEKETK